VGVGMIAAHRPEWRERRGEEFAFAIAQKDLDAVLIMLSDDHIEFSVAIHIGNSPLPSRAL